uniref:Uncharacterized protein n=1 Tax=Oryza rufipogon TaxID=4529 RepID=A0A0E0NVP2_ORYRU
MGVLFSCPVDDYDALEESAAAAAAASSESNSGGGKPAAILKALGSGKLLIEGSLSFKRDQQMSPTSLLQVETEISIKPAAADIAAAPRASCEFMSPAEEDEEFWGSLKRISSESYPKNTATDNSEDQAAEAEETGNSQMPRRRSFNGAAAPATPREALRPSPLQHGLVATVAAAD